MQREGITRSSTALPRICGVSRRFRNLKIRKRLITLSTLIMSMAIRLPYKGAPPKIHSEECPV